MQKKQCVAKILETLLASTFDGMELKKLKGHQDIYRVRTGDIRIIFKKQGKEIVLLDIAHRSEDTYRQY